MNKHTQEPSAASQNSMNRRAEEPPRVMLFLIIALAGGILITLLVFVLISSSATTSKTVLDEQEKYGLYSNTVVRGLYTITAVRFADAEGASCTKSDNYQRTVIMSMRFQSYQVPDTCDVFVNSKYLRTERKLDPDCRTSCDFQEYTRQFTLGDLDYRDSHVIRVCCNDICVERQLAALCNK